MTVFSKLKKGFTFINSHSIGTTINEIRIRNNENKMASVCSSTPRFAQIEVTTACNLFCATCRDLIEDASSDFFKAKHMSFQDYKNILDKLPDLVSVRLNGIGEPLLNPSIFDMVKYAVSKNIHVHFFSNGTCLDKKRAQQILDSGLQGILFSIDGATPEVFENIRKGAVMADVVRDIKNFVDLANRSGSGITISTMTTVSDLNLHELPQIIRLVDSLGIKHAMVKRMITWTDNLLDKMVSSQDSKYFSESIDVARELGVDLKIGDMLDDQENGQLSKHRGKKAICDWPWRSIYITVDGIVTPCCNIFDPSIINFGNILTDELNDIWNNSKMIQLRADFNDGLPLVCHKTCGEFLRDSRE